MFCFLHLPYHANSTVNIRKSNSTQIIRRRLFEFYEMGPNNADLPSSFRRLLFRRSHSEPIKRSISEENEPASSRTDPEWSMTIDSISLQSSYLEYQKRRKNRLRKQENQKSVNTTTSSNSDLMKINEMNQLDLKFESDSSTSNELSSSMAKEISYEDEIRNFVENVILEPISNIFADPFESDEKKSRTEQWVEAVSPNKILSDETENLDLMNKKMKLEKQKTVDSLISSTVSQSSLIKSSFKQNLQEAVETQSQIDVNEVDKFWDYLYDKNLDSISPNSKKVQEEIEERSQSNLADIHMEIANSSLSNMTEKNREIEEIEERPEDYFMVQQIAKTRNISSQTSFYSAKNQNRNRFYTSHVFANQMFNSLKILLIERDRAKIGLDRLPNRILQELSEKANYSQARYRFTMEQNKERLDRRIDEIWRKLRKESIDDPEIRDFINVSSSEQLTMNATRNLPL
ncbi:unnamed protein product [Caenorhabditis angaria]|uniref:Uncharacterized protein n=1 Tax=Caenorhabditis angaria TaxID=860376 RepID=A0A9P1IPL3_9PELO|nr:unnamed protein product [Caenorhabditis angaria]